MIKFTESKLLKWIKNPRPETTLASWLREKRRNQRIKALEERENLIRRTAYKLWEEDGKPNNNSEYYWFKAIQTKRPIRRFAAWWEATAIEKWLEDISFLLKNAAVLDIINLLAGITIIISLITWLTGKTERWENEIFFTWNVVKEATGDKSGVAKLAIERLLKNKFSLAGLDLSKTNLERVNLQEADLWKVNLQEAVLSEANLQGAFLRETNLRAAVLSKADLQEAFLLEADLQGAKGLTPKQIKSACYWKSASYKYNKTENDKYIEKLKKDSSSDPEKPINCKHWETPESKYWENLEKEKAPPFLVW